MTIWIAVWLLLSSVLLYFFVWTFFILQRQKKVWQKFGDDFGLRYKKGGLWDTPRLEGVYEGYTISLFASEHMREDMRSSRKMTAIEFTLHCTLPFDGAIASGGMIDVLKMADFGQEYQPDVKAWHKSYIARASHRIALQKYLTHDRLKALIGLMRIKNAWFISAFRNDIFVVRIDTPYALDDRKSLEVLILKMFKACKALEVNKAELRELSAIVASPDEFEKNKADTKIAEIDLDDIGDLELETDDLDGQD